MPTVRISDFHTAKELATGLGVDAKQMREYADSTRQKGYYNEIWIPKRGRKRVGQYRHVYASRHNWLANLHRQIAITLNGNLKPGDHVQGFIQGRSIRSNARQHLGAKSVLHADIKDFFDSITVEQVEASLKALGAVPIVASLLARCATIDGHLRQGTRCSPAVANLVCQHLDVDLIQFAKGNDLIYTRYADDLTFSTQARIERSDESRLVKGLDELVESRGFELRKDSCYLQKRGRSQFVTGLSIADPHKPRLPRQLKKRLRLIMYYVEKYGFTDHFDHSDGRSLVVTKGGIWGMIRFVNSIEPALAEKLRAQYAAGEDKDPDESYGPDYDDYYDPPIH